MSLFNITTFVVSFLILLSISLFKNFPIFSGIQESIIYAPLSYVIILFFISLLFFKKEEEEEKLANIIFSLFIVSSALLLFPASFQVNDDIEIIKFVGNGFDTTFMSVLLGRILSFLYLDITADIPWYTFFLYFCHIISVTLIITGIKVLRLKRIVSSIIFTIFISYYLYFLILLTFTSTALMLGITSCFLYFCLLENKEAHRNNLNHIYILLTLGLFISSCYLIRTSAAKGISLLSLPIFLYYYKKWKSHLILFFPIAIIISLNIYLENYTTTSAYKEFNEFNQQRGKVHGYPLRKINKKRLLEANSWTENDFLLFVFYWTFSDERKYNFKTLSLIKEIESPLKPFSVQEIKNILKSNKIFIIEHLSEVLFLFSLILLLLFPSAGKKKFFLISFSVYVISIVAIMNTYYRFPPWVSKPVFLFILLSMLLHGKDKKIDTSKINALKSGAFIVFGLIFIINSIIELEREIIFQNNSSLKRENIEKKLLSIDKNPVFYILPRISMFPRNSVYRDYNDSKIFDLASGWSTFSPYFHNKINSIGINTGSDILPWMINHSNTYFITDYTDYTADYSNRLVQFIDETYMIKCSVENIKYFDRFLIFRLKKTDSKLENK